MEREGWSGTGWPSGHGDICGSPLPAPAVLPPERRHREDPHPFLLPPCPLPPAIPWPPAPPALAACWGGAHARERGAGRGRTPVPGGEWGAGEDKFGGAMGTGHPGDAASAAEPRPVPTRVSRTALPRPPARRGRLQPGSSPGDAGTSLRWHVLSPCSNPRADRGGQSKRHRLAEGGTYALPPPLPFSSKQAPRLRLLPAFPGCRRLSAASGTGTRAQPALSRGRRRGLAGAEGPHAAGRGVLIPSGAGRRCEAGGRCLPACSAC